MPFTPTSPELRNIAVTAFEQRSLDDWRMTHVDVYMLVGQEPALRVEVEVGSKADPEFIAYDRLTIDIIGDDAAEVLGSTVTTGLSRLSDFGVALWTKLVEMGKVPGGSVG